MCNNVEGADSFAPAEHCLNTTAYQSLVADLVHPSVATVYPCGCLQYINGAYHIAHIIPNSVLEHDTVLLCPPIDELWDVVKQKIRIMDVPLTSLQQVCDAIMLK